MKKLFCALLMAVLLLCGCSQTQTDTSVSPTVNTQEPTETASASTGSTETPDVSVSLYSGDSTDLLIGIDQFGRTFDIQAGTKDREVGMFFWLWQGPHNDIGQQSGNYDAAKIMEEYGMDELFHKNTRVSPANQFHFWGEPLWGYYDQRDEWVVRKQMELLTNAGVDFLVFDTTNSRIYEDVYPIIMKVISQMMAQGWDAPQVAFYTHSASMDTARSLYNKIYKANLYPETWYHMNGKPLIIAYTDPADDIKEALSRGDKNYNPAPFSQEMLDFFTFRKPQWPSDPFYADGFPWMEWSYPQYAHNGVMNVSVAAHPQVPMSFSLTRGHKNWGRGYNVNTHENVAEDVMKGTFIQSQWETVFKKDPQIVFVDGWNEWIALKSEYLGEYMMCDAVNMEYSREIEMMKGGYNDAFYIQLIMNIRKYRGLSFDKIAPATSKTIDIMGDVAQWDNIEAEYVDTALESIERKHKSAGSKRLIYTEAAARNDIRKVKVTQDANNFYFLIECASDITGSGEGFMNLFIGTGELKAKGWEGYEYVINRNISGNDSDVIKLNADFTGEKCGSAKVNVSGKYMQVEIPRAAIGMENSNSLYFKVADNITNPSDIMDYYVSGKSFPIGRLSYRYLG